MGDSAIPAARAGIKWTSLASAWSVGLQFAVLGVLARVLRQEEFGLMTMGMAVMQFAQVFGDSGTTLAILHRQKASEASLSSVFWFNLMLAAVVFGAVQAVTPAAVAYFEEPAVGPILSLLSFAVLIGPAGEVFHALLWRDLRFKQIALADGVAHTLGGGVAIGGALSGWGAKALVAGALARAAVRTAMLFTFGRRIWRPSLHFSYAELKGFLSFGMFQLGEKLLTQASWSADKLLIGKLLGAGPLGYYAVAWNLMIQPVATLNPILTKVAFPLFAQRQDDDAALRRGWHKLLSAVSLVNMPIYLGMFAIAPTLIRCQCGPGWETTADVLRILSLVGVFYCLGNPIGVLFTAKGRADWSFYMNIIVAIVTVAGVVVGATWGLQGVAFGLLVGAALLLPIEYLFQRRLIGLAPAAAIAPVVPYAALAAAMAVIVLIAGRPELGAPFVRLAILVLLGAVVYTGGAYLFRREMLVEIARSIIPRRGAAAP